MNCKEEAKCGECRDLMHRIKGMQGMQNTRKCKSFDENAKLPSVIP